MSNSRKTKWDWAPHLPYMRELHHTGKSIPQIHRAIQSDDFKPSERAVYNRFLQEGLSTGHDRKRSHLQNESTAKTETCGVSARQKSAPPSLLDENSSEASKCVHADDSMEELAPQAQGTAFTPLMSPNAAGEKSYGPEVHQTGVVEALIDTSPGLSLSNRTASDGVDITDHDGAGLASDFRPTISAPQSSGPFVAERSVTCRSQRHKKRSKLSPDEQDALIQEKLREFGILPNLQHSGGRTRHPDRVKTPNKTPNYRSKTLMGRLSPWSNNKSTSETSRANQSSPFPDNDSGYASGRGTPSTLPYRASLASDYEPPIEFEGLHRVGCYFLHEPGPSCNYISSKSCHICSYSAIHNLAWVAKHLKIAEFEEKLSSNDIYDLQALDAAGNSALHYAAKSGASYFHLKALIKAGAPTYVQNTAKQNFLHCLQPCEAANDGGGVDCFKSGLVELLEMVEFESVLGQQDNDGQTVLHMLASHIEEPELRDRTFKFFSKRGLPAGVTNRFGKSAKDLRAPKYKYGQTMFAAETLSLINSQSRDAGTLEVSDWERDQLRRMSDQNIILESHNNPRYMDSKTKDTVFHALSRVNTQSQGNMQDLRQSIARGANLNRHNCDGHHPLAAFICNQRFRESKETGATMAKYIDILLWKDKKHCYINNINVDMMTATGTTALYEAAVHAQPDTVRSLIEAGANVNVRRDNDPRGLSVLRATYLARDKAVIGDEEVRMHLFKEVISHLLHARAVEQPTSLEARGCIP